MRRSSALAGIVGLVLLCFGLVDYFIAAGFRFFVFVNIAGGGFALIVWLTSSRALLGTMVGRRTTRYGANAVVYSVGFIGLLALLNYLSSLHHKRFDMTEEHAFSLASESVQVVKNLKKPLKLYGFFEGGDNERARALYESYQYASPKVSYELVDPDKHPELAEKYKVSVIGTTRIQYGGDEGEGTNITDLSEENLTNGVVKVTKGRKKVIYFLEGHGEADPDDAEHPTGMASLRQALEGEGYEVRKLVLAVKPEVPADCNVLVIAGPQKPLLQHELDQVDQYLKRGGRAVVMLQPPSPDQPDSEAGLLKLVGDWGITPGNDVVVDQVLRLFAGPALGLSPIVTSYGDHPVTKSFTQRTVFPMTRSVEPKERKAAGIAVTALAKTSETSWAETDVADIFKHQTAKFDGKDRRGPITVADAVEGDLKQINNKDGYARLIVLGDTEFADNQYLNNFFNRDFVINGTDWLVGEENAISIRPRSLHGSRLRLTVDEYSLMFALSVLLVPEMLLIVGIVVWWERRN